MQNRQPSDLQERIDRRRSAETHMVIDGRRWRRTDPAIDDDLRQSLVDELMSARRAVKSAKRDDDSERVAAARRRVDDAKVALGERGPTWWDEIDSEDVSTRVAACRRALGDSGTDVSTDDLSALLGLDEEGRRAGG